MASAQGCEQAHGPRLDAACQIWPGFAGVERVSLGPLQAHWQYWNTRMTTRELGRPAGRVP